MLAGQRKRVEASSIWLFLSPRRRCNVMATSRPRASFQAKHLEADLAKLLKVWSWKRFRGLRLRGSVLPELWVEGQGIDLLRLPLPPSARPLRRWWRPL
jgi:hypothetical protein